MLVGDPVCGRLLLRPINGQTTFSEGMWVHVHTMRCPTDFTDACLPECDLVYGYEILCSSLHNRGLSDMSLVLLCCLFWLLFLPFVCNVLQCIPQHTLMHACVQLDACLYLCVHVLVCIYHKAGKTPSLLLLCFETKFWWCILFPIIETQGATCMKFCSRKGCFPKLGSYELHGTCTLLPVQWCIFNVSCVCMHACMCVLWFPATQEADHGEPSVLVSVSKAHLFVYFDLV